MNSDLIDRVVKCLERKKFGKAEDVLNIALQQAPEDLTVVNLLIYCEKSRLIYVSNVLVGEGHIARRRGDIKKAFLKYEEALSMNSDNKNAQECLCHLRKSTFDFRIKKSRKVRIKRKQISNGHKWSGRRR